MRKKREIVDGATYHVTSRTNNKINVFNTIAGRRVMQSVLTKAKEKFNFMLFNFCVMPTHIHLLIKPIEGTNLDRIMQWIKTTSAKYWNNIQNTTDHLWGERYFSRIIKSQNEYDTVMNYIDQNPVKAGLVTDPADWKISGAYFRKHDIEI